MTTVTKREFRNIEGEKIEQYNWFIRGASLEQEGAIYARIRKEMLENYTIKN